MKLIVKVNLVLILVFAVAFVVTGLVTNRLLQRNAKLEVLENARIMIEAALAVRTYTATEIKPLLQTQIKYTFLPQIVPAYSANQYFAQLRKKFPDYSYREATLNPTNPVNRASDWEADIVRHFRQSPDQTELIGERDTPNGKSLFLARPMKIKDGNCLYCHDTPEDAPKTMIERYGPANGFGWKLNDVLTAQIVSAPTELPLRRARTALVGFLISLAIVFGVALLAVNAMLVGFVTRPVNQLAAIANEVSLGNLEAPEFHSTGKDEIANLAQSFSRMRKSMVEAIKMLEPQ
jgi:HAMP domain-containing protein